MRIALLTRSLNYGGAERQLVVLARGLAERGHRVEVLSMYSGGPLAGELAGCGVRLRELGKRGRWDVIGFLVRMVRALREARPDVVHTYLVAPNLLAVLLRPLLPPAPVVWGVRASDMDFSRYDTLARVTFAVSRRLARHADRIVVNSHAGVEFHAARGYPAERMQTIPNGIDTGRFAPDPQAGAAMRTEWGLSQDAPVVGLVGRLDPMKDHPTFLAAASRLAAERDDVRFVLVGSGPAGYRQQLERSAADHGLEGRLVWAGGVGDMRGVHNAFDVCVSSSAFGEGFPNVVAEALACGRPCVVTDVGDSARVIGPCGIVVPPGEPIALADAMRRCLEDPPATPEARRRRVIDEFSVKRLIDRTEAVLAALVEPPAPEPSASARVGA